MVNNINFKGLPKLNSENVKDDSTRDFIYVKTSHLP